MNKLIEILFSLRDKYKKRVGENINLVGDKVMQISEQLREKFSDVILGQIDENLYKILRELDQYFQEIKETVLSFFKRQPYSQKELLSSNLNEIEEILGNYSRIIEEKNLIIMNLESNIKMKQKEFLEEKSRINKKINRISQEINLSQKFRKLNEKENQLRNNAKGLDLVELKTVIDGFKIRLDKKEGERKSLSSENIRLNSIIENINDKLNGLHGEGGKKYSEISFSRTEKMEEKIGKNKEKVKNLKEKIKIFEDTIDQFSDVINDKNIEIMKLTHKIKDLEKNNLEMDIYI